MKNTILKILFLLFIFSAASFAQTEQDSLRTVQKEDSVFVMTKSPWGAVARSAVLPGWGQFYNESYWKIPIVWGGLGFLIYGYKFYNDRLNEFRSKYTESLANDDPMASSYLRSREFYKDNRDLFAVYIGLAYFLNMLDAYIDAHLFDFDVSENMFTGAPQLGIRFNF